MFKPAIKQTLRNEAMKEICRDLKNNVDYQEIVDRIGNDSRYAPLLSGKDADEQYDYLYGMVQNAGTLLGHYLV